MLFEIEVSVTRVGVETEYIVAESRDEAKAELKAKLDGQCDVKSYTIEGITEHD